jgi:hypothetical protein
MGERRNLYRMLVENCVGKRALGRHKWRGEDIKMNFKGTGSEGVEWINLAEEKDK